MNYSQILTDLADSIKEEAAKHGQDIQEVTQEAIDGCQYVIYTDHHQNILAASNNPHTPASEEWRHQAAAVYLTMLDDIQEYL